MLKKITWIAFFLLFENEAKNILCGHKNVYFVIDKKMQKGYTSETVSFSPEANKIN